MIRTLVCLLTATTVVAAEPAVLVEHRKIWDAAPHNAFTDLVRFGDRWFCVFREGKGHVSPDGALRVIASRDGVKWESAALITSANSDLRDAKIVVTPDNRLMLCGAEALHDKSKKRHQSLVWFSDDGVKWSERHEVGDPNFWLWRVTWNKGVAYTVGYDTNPDRNKRSLRLYSAADGKAFAPVVTDLLMGKAPGENTLRFRADGSAVMLLRRDPYTGNPPIPESAATALWGTSKAPYREWEWKDLGVRIGGPNVIELPDGKWIAVVRLHKPKTRTVVCRLDADAGKLVELLELPSGGDSSYAGMVHHEGLLWISYYSSHEGKTSIYLAKVRFAKEG